MLNNKSAESVEDYLPHEYIGSGEDSLKLNASVRPKGSLELLSQHEISRLQEVGNGELYELFRRCALAVLNCDAQTDEATEVFESYDDFDIEILQRTRGIKLEVRNAPGNAFVDGVMLNGVRDHLFAVLRDVVFMASELYEHGADSAPLDQPEGRRSFRQDNRKPQSINNNLVFDFLRNAGLLNLHMEPNLVVCWGGHSISREEYNYSKDVGYQLGLRGMDICTGCGPGAMKGPMKGAAIGHAKQRRQDGRYIGITEPGIIAAESPNPIVNQLVVLPDIEKRLEAFVRLGHGILVFPGGVGTLEEILFLLGILMEERNRHISMPLVFCSSKSSKGYFQKVDRFLVSTLGKQVRDYYRIIEDDPVATARYMKQAMRTVTENRRETRDAFYYNWLLRIPPGMKEHFHVSHTSMANLDLSRELAPSELVVNLRRAFSGIVAGNVKDHGIRMVREHGPFQMTADSGLMEAMDGLLSDFVEENRMKLPTKTYNPCYAITAPA